MLKIALRGQDGVWMDEGPPNCRKGQDFNRPNIKNCRAFTFSSDGTLFAFCDTSIGKVVVMDTQSNHVVCELPAPAAIFLVISPRNNLIATWQQYKTKDGQQGEPNLSIWDARTGRLVKAFIQKKHDTWEPQWSADESVCARNVSNEVHFFENNNFDAIAQKLHLQKIADYRLARHCKSPVSVAAYAPGSKGQPSFVRLFRYPHFAGLHSALANKSFYNADRVDMIWNKKGSVALVLAAADVSADSYYGDQGLYFISMAGDSCLVPRDKNGPVYSVEWNPNSTEFCVVYGFMPAKAALYNLQCEPVFDFGTGPRNVVYYNPFGNLLCLAGFGNLNGNMEMWDLASRTRVVQYHAKDSTYFEWSPDGTHLLTATTSPRLRVGNGYKIWTATGKLVHEYASGTEVWEVMWQQAPEGTYAASSIASMPAPQQQAAPKKYVPPAMRGRSDAELVTKYRQGEDQAASNVRKQQEEPKSKNALKNAKKREAKKRQQQGGEVVPDSRPQSSINTPSQPQHSGASAAQSNPETDKKIRNVQKKLQQIEKLKAKVDAGEQLEKNQLDKLKTESALLEELENLQLGA